MSQAGQPDWDRIAEKFDVFLPQIAPVGAALLDALEAAPGDRIIDLASGTGEPALTLARGRPDVQVTGTDAAEGMVRAARAKAAASGLANITFATMAAERLDFPDASFDRALCRFGVMLFEDPLRGCREVRRVLKPGGRFVFSVWRSPETMTTMCWSARALRGRVPRELEPQIERIAALGGPGVLDTLLIDAGFTIRAITAHRFDFRFASFEAYWEMVEASDILRRQFDALPAERRDPVRDEIAGFAREYRSGDGLVIPHECLLAVAER